MAVILIGTSGWSYPKGEGAWNGTFYPAQVKTGQEPVAQLPDYLLRLAPKPGTALPSVVE